MTPSTDGSDSAAARDDIDPSSETSDVGTSTTSTTGMLLSTNVLFLEGLLPLPIAGASAMLESALIQMGGRGREREEAPRSDGYFNSIMLFSARGVPAILEGSAVALQKHLSNLHRYFGICSSLRFDCEHGGEEQIIRFAALSPPPP